jgi:hypothetical protein
MPDFITTIIIPADETRDATVTNLVIDSDGSTLHALQAAVGGYVDVVRIEDATDMWVNDEGLINGSPFNSRATHVAHSVKVAIADGHYPGYIGNADATLEAIAWMREVRVFGDVVITGHDDEGNTTSVPDDMVKFLREEVGLLG